MRDLVLAVVISVLVSAGISYWMVERLRTERASVSAAANRAPAAASANLARRTEPTMITSILFPSGGSGRCSTSSTPRVGSVGAGTVQWNIHPVGQGWRNCFSNGETIKIVPKAGNTSPLTPMEPAGFPMIKADHANSATHYFYELIMVDKAGNRLYSLEDPELEIIEVRVAQQ